MVTRAVGLGHIKEMLFKRHKISVRGINSKNILHDMMTTVNDKFLKLLRHLKKLCQVIMYMLIILI